MSLKSDMITYLADQSGISDLVGTRIQWGRSAQSEDMPRITMDLISNDDFHHMTAASGKANKRVQINCVADTSLGTENLAEAVRAELHGFRGTMGAGYVSSCHLAAERDANEEAISGSDTDIFEIQQDYLIGHTVTVPTF